MIGDFRTDALHQALRESQIEDTTLLGLLVLALAGKNVSVQSGADMSPFDRERIAATITEGGVLTSDFGLIRTAARRILVAALSCRDNITNSGPGARIAGEAIGASLYLPTMATDEFLSCLSRQALEKAATTKACGPRSACATPAPGSSSASAIRATSTRPPSSNLLQKRSLPQRRPCRATSRAGPARSRMTASTAMPEQARTS